MASFVGKGEITGLGSCVVTIASTAYRVLDSVGITHQAEAVPIKDGDGKIVGYIWNDDEGIEMDIEARPLGATFANARTGAGIPVPLTVVTLSAFPAIGIGAQADALNTATGIVWMYLGGATLKATGDATVPWVWSMKIVMRKNVTSSTAIV